MAVDFEFRRYVKSANVFFSVVIFSRNCTLRSILSVVSALLIFC